MTEQRRDNKCRGKQCTAEGVMEDIEHGDYSNPPVDVADQAMRYAMSRGPFETKGAASHALKMVTKGRRKVNK